MQLSSGRVDEIQLQGSGGGAVDAGVGRRWGRGLGRCYYAGLGRAMVADTPLDVDRKAE
jgi:hypothetical protein